MAEPSFILLNPGPVLLDDRVRTAMNGPDACHREAEVSALVGRTRDALTRLSGGDGDHTAVLITGSGTAAVESMIVSVVGSGRLLVLDNGHYGDRMAQIATAHGLDSRVLTFGWGCPVDLDQVQAELTGDPEITHVALVHHETSSGMLNDLRSVTSLAHRHGVEVLVDAVSSVGCEDLDLARGDADWIAGSSNKCIESVPGLSFVVGPMSGFDALTDSTRAFYLCLRRHYRAQRDGTVPFTPAVPALRALDVACTLLLEEGVAPRRSRYAGLTHRVRDELRAAGWTIRLEPEHRSSCLSAIDLPHAWSYSQLHDRLLARGIVIYASQGPLARSQFRIATMGQLTDESITRLLAAMPQVQQPAVLES